MQEAAVFTPLFSVVSNRIDNLRRYIYYTKYNTLRSRLLSLCSLIADFFIYLTIYIKIKFVVIVSCNTVEFLRILTNTLMRVEKKICSPKININNQKESTVTVDYR